MLVFSPSVYLTVISINNSILVPLLHMDDLESKVDWEEHRQDKHHHSTLRLAEFGKQPIEWLLLLAKVQYHLYAVSIKCNF